ncbi:MAG: GBS Bsp-like repeat-containing protein [Ruminococcus sp.]|nr:GBS Bsp-like repeat-containing protein [Ruminococcus sp.]
MVGRVYVYAVNTLEHNDESGEYSNDVYAYDKSGNIIDRWCIETKHRTYVNVPNDKVINNVSIINVTPFGYDVKIKVEDDSVIDRIAVPVWTTNVAVETESDEPGQDDLIFGWQSRCIAEKSDSNTYLYHVNISDHNEENGEYCNDVYIYDKSGNLMDRWCIETGHITYAYVPKNIRGDINIDETFNISDAVLLQKWLLMEEKELLNWKAADLCEDNKIDVFDMIEMRKLIINSQSVQ